ncbi:MAG TPA: pilin [Candidatus Saccharimonadales bacterium]
MKKYIFTSLILLALLSTQSIIGNAIASSAINGASTGNCNSSSQVDIGCLPDVSANSTTFATAMNIVFSIIGAISVLIIIIAGFKFITSSGKPEQVARAKDTIIYAAVGLIVCIFAVTIVSFVAGFI